MSPLEYEEAITNILYNNAFLSIRYLFILEFEIFHVNYFFGII